jgi:hypothetical protein
MLLLNEADRESREGEASVVVKLSMTEAPIAACGGVNAFSNGLQVPAAATTGGGNGHLPTSHSVEPDHTCIPVSSSSFLSTYAI